MNLRTIRVTLNAALRSIAPEKAGPCIGRAQQLLTHARDRASSASVVAEIDALQAELEGARSGSQRQG